MEEMRKLLKSADHFLANSIAGNFYNRYVRLGLMELAMAMPVGGVRTWRGRVRDVVDDPNNEYIPRVPHAGEIRRGVQIMHNGLVIAPASYYGLAMMLLLNKNRGVHEPQEERVFAAVLPHLKPGAVMLELGSYWGFYSMWFLKSVAQGRSWLVEPNPVNLEFGKRNFRLNGLEGTFIRGFVGARAEMGDGGPQLTVDGLVAEYGIPFVDILHSDVQGAEYDMLLGAEESFRQQKIGYVFISTHSQELHLRCMEFLTRNGFCILASANLEETYAHDGLLVARAAHVTAIEPVSILQRPAGRGPAIPSRSATVENSRRMAVC